jgi:hypothetical protein
MWQKVLVAGFIALLLANVVIGVLNYRHLRILEEKSLSLQYDLARMAEAFNADTIEPNVGTIQFLHRGYTIELVSVKYESSGLTLKGYVGSPNWIWISNLTLDFYASKHQTFEEYKKDSQPGSYIAVSNGVWLPVTSSQEVGSAQTSPIPTLAPATRQSFEVTIPNVRQETDYQRKPILSVRFSGERYSYGP